MLDRHFSTFHIAGFTYYDGIDVYENLKMGTKLTLQAEPVNQFDAYAVMIFYKNTKLGYVPAGENALISKLLNCGHTDLLEVKINQITPDAHPEKQIRVVVRIVEKK